MGLYYRYKKSDEKELIVSNKRGLAATAAAGSSKLPKSMDAKAWSRYGYGNTPSDSETPNDVLVGFADAGYLSDPHKGRSQTGYVFTMGNTAISWRSTKQTLVATSSNHAEIIALHEAVKESIWLRSVITHIRESSGLESTTMGPTCIYEDNAACIEQMKLGYIKGDNTKHIAPKFFYNQQQQKTLNIEVKQVSSEENLADLFTKSLPKSTFVKHVKSIGMCRLSELDE